MIDFSSSLPIDAVLPEIGTTLAATTSLVLQASPGAGKTTRVPLSLLDQPWLEGRKIIMLEPRRLAARMAAGWMARSLGEDVGQTVGYTIRFENRSNRQTRILVVTEGILTRMIQDDPTLEEVGLVIFDEFHERSLHADLGLALCLDVQRALRPDLRLMVMSATLDGAAVAALLGTQAVLTCPGQSFPVETRYVGGDRQSMPDALSVARSVRTALRETSGDVLVFLPGVGEINRTLSLLEEGAEPNLVLAPLYGDLSQQAQDRAIQPAGTGKRKVVLATSIAETSLTVDGVRVVIDAGWRRVSRFDPRSGMERLETVRIAQAAADQRRGRAGRQGPGVCYRLWSEETQRTLAPFETPEILEADLAPLALDLAVWGVRDPASLSWLDSPPAAALSRARSLLLLLEAITEDGQPTQQGQRMATLAAHPRLARMMSAGHARKQGNLACLIAALLSERDILRGKGRDADVRTRLEHMHREGGDGVDRAAVRQVRRIAEQWQRRLGRQKNEEADGDPGLLLALAYPDRVARRRSGGDRSFLMVNGQGAFFRDADPLSAEEWLVIADVDGERTNARIYLAAPLHESALDELFSEQIKTQRIVTWDEREEVVRAVQRRMLGALVLKEKPLPINEAKEETDQALLEGIRRMGIGCLPWTDGLESWRQRVAFMRRLEADSWPDLSDATLLETLEDWLLPYVEGMVRRAHLARLDLSSLLLHNRLDWAARTRLDEMAPTHLAVPSGSHVPIDYSGEEPVLSVRLQEMFGMAQTPTIAGGRVALLLHLLSPARRPVQVTRDLQSFWNNGYRAVKADLKGRYPKHYWPDNPLEATPTARIKKFSRP